MEFLTPFRHGSELNQVERWKLERHPFDVYRAVIDEYAPLGSKAPAAIAAIPGETERLKWLGIYPQRDAEDAHMMRFKVPGGRLNVAQAAAIGAISDEYGQGPYGNARWGQGFCDITTRQDIQLHWVRISDVPDIWERLEEVGLGTLQACGDSNRNVLCCPVAGVDGEEVFDAFPVAQAISAFFTGNREYANLPRKFKISLTGCLEDCAQAEINDIGLLPARHDDGRLGFNLLVGGGLSDGPRLASDIDVFIVLDQAVELTRAIAQLYGELGNREHRGLCRMRYLVQELGPERFRSELAYRAAFVLEPAGEALTHGYRGDHVGVHAQRQAGSVYVGLNVTVGRIAGADLVEAARLAQTYGDGGVRLTSQQNLVLTGVSEDRLEDLLAEPLLGRHSPFPRPFARGAVACTGTEFCRFAIIETKQRMADWVQRLDEQLAPAENDCHGDPEIAVDGQGHERSDGDMIRLHLSGCSASCAQPQIADIGFRGETAHRDGRLVEAVDIGLGGSLGIDAAFIDWVAGAVPVEDVPNRIVSLVKQFRAERHPNERFYQWVRRIGPETFEPMLTSLPTAAPPQATRNEQVSAAISKKRESRQQ